MADERITPKLAIPKGVRVFPPEEAAVRLAVQERLLSVFRRWGFREVITPAFEYLEVFTGIGGGEQDEKIFTFVDRQTGRLLALRYDLTPQVARMVATSLRHRPLPLRLAYAAPVFRQEEIESGRQREFVQVGVELIGLKQPEADAEMIAMAVEGCQAVGLTQFQIDVGQVEYFRGLVEALAVSSELKRQIASAVSRKDSLELSLLLSGVRADPAVTEALLTLPNLYGGKEILAKAEALTSEPRSRKALANLAQVYEILEHYNLSDRVILDLGEAPRAFDYHTGVIFGAYARGLGYQLSSGGRYDNLIGHFGDPCPAIGFAFDLERVLLALQAEGSEEETVGPDFLIIDFNPDKRDALRIAHLLRVRGFSVARDIITRDLSGSLEYAKSTAIRRAVILGEKGTRRGELRVSDLTTGAEQTHTTSAFCRAVEQGENPWPT